TLTSTLFPYTTLFRSNFVRSGIGGNRPSGENGADRRKIQEQYRAVWGEEFTRRHGRAIGFLELTSLLEKVSYPLILLFLVIFSRSEEHTSELQSPDHL